MKNLLCCVFGLLALEISYHCLSNELALNSATCLSFFLYLCDRRHRRHLPSYIFSTFLSPLVSLSEFVVWCETSTEASSDNEQAKRNDRLLLGTAIKAHASFGARLLSQRASFPLLTMPLRRLRSYLQPDDLWLRLDDDVYKETRSKNPLEFSLSLPVDLISWIFETMILIFFFFDKFRIKTFTILYYVIIFFLQSLNWNIFIQ